MKDLLDEIDSRIKSPLFGYFMFSSVALNWKQLFYLTVHDGTVSERINHFNDGTDVWSLFVFPLLLASIYALLYPWIQYAFMYFGRKPTELKNSLQAQSEHKLLIRRQELEKARSDLLEVAEKELIGRAKRDAQLEDIEDESLREKLQSEIDNLRKERDSLRGTINNKEEENPSHLAKEQEEIIQLITSNGGTMGEGEIIAASSFDKVKTEYFLEDLLENGYLVKDYDMDGKLGYYYDLTTRSKKIMVEKGFVQ